MNPEEIKKEWVEWVDGASYEQLLSRWRNAPAGDPFFIGKMGDYYKKKMSEKRSEVSDAEHVRASKSIGWRR